MASNSHIMKKARQQRALLLRKVVLPLLLVLLTTAFVGMSTGQAHAALRPVATSTQQADSAPALIAFNGTVYIGWTGRNTAHNVNLMTYDPTSATFGPAQVLTETTLIGSGPSLVMFHNHFYVAWMGTDHRLNIGQYNPADPTHLANKVTLREFSNNAPSVATFNDRLYLSWKGTDGRLNIISSTDAATFNTKVTYSMMVNSSPTLVAKNMYLFLAWEEMSTSSSIVFAHYDPSHPAVLNSIVTVASTSALPVGLFPAGVANPYLRVAWRTAADAHIRLAIFEGGQYLHNPLYMAETTPYGPALYAPYLCWTGTDAAQSINVSQVNI